MCVGEEMSAALERSEITLPSVTGFIMSPFVNSTQRQDSPGKYFVPPAVKCCRVIHRTVRSWSASPIFTFTVELEMKASSSTEASQQFLLKYSLSTKKKKKKNCSLLIFIKWIEYIEDMKLGAN